MTAGFRPPLVELFCIDTVHLAPFYSDVLFSWLADTVWFFSCPSDHFFCLLYSSLASPLKVTCLRVCPWPLHFSFDTISFTPRISLLFNVSITQSTSPDSLFSASDLCVQFHNRCFLLCVSKYLRYCKMRFIIHPSTTTLTCLVFCFIFWCYCEMISSRWTPLKFMILNLVWSFSVLSLDRISSLVI